MHTGKSVSWVYLGFILLLSACVQPQTRTGTPAASPPTRTPLSDSSERRSLQSTAFSTGTISYLYENTAAIESTFGDSLPRFDSIQTTAVVTINFRQAVGETIATVTTDSTRAAFTSSSAAGRSMETWPNDTRAVVIDQTTGRTTMPTMTGTCTQESRELPLLGTETIPVLPATTPITTSWVDTLTRELCRGGVLLRFRHTLRYRLEPMLGSEFVYRVIRDTESEIMGNGRQWQQDVQATGRGAAADTFLIAKPSSRISHISGSSRLEISFRTALREQSFVQTTRTQVIAR